MTPLRTLWRSLRVAEHLATGAAIALYVRIRSRDGRCPYWLPNLVSWWHGRLCRALGIRLRIEGQIQPGCLLVGNHVSWLDIPILGAQGELGFLSKAEVRTWPLIGWMAEIAGTLFIERGAHQAEHISSRLVADISRGRALMIFPEGTTTDGTCVQRFHPRLFGAAQGPGLRVQPVAIGYRAGDATTPDAQVPYVGEDTLVANLWRVIRHPELVARVHFLPPLEAVAGERRRELAARARSLIIESLALSPEAEARTMPPLHLPPSPAAEEPAPAELAPCLA
jgi:lyso-ornithine lipid O-acyltransferase